MIEGWREARDFFFAFLPWVLIVLLLLMLQEEGEVQRGRLEGKMDSIHGELRAVQQHLATEGFVLSPLIEEGP